MLLNEQLRASVTRLSSSVFPNKEQSLSPDDDDDDDDATHPNKVTATNVALSSCMEPDQLPALIPNAVRYLKSCHRVQKTASPLQQVKL